MDGDGHRLLPAVARGARGPPAADTTRDVWRAGGERGAGTRRGPAVLCARSRRDRGAAAQRRRVRRRRHRRRNATVALADQRLQVRENLVFELLQALMEGGAERVAPAAALPEALEVLHRAIEAVTRDEVVGHQERELVGRERAFLQMADGEAARRAERVEIELRRDERRVRADPGRGHGAAMLHGVEAEALEDAERDPLRHAFGEPLLGATLALRELDLRDVRELVRDQSQPFTSAMVVRLVVEEELTAPADADREV